jgi:hypothetical protein
MIQEEVAASKEWIISDTKRLFGLVCSKDFAACPFRSCAYLQKCCKIDYEQDELLMKKKRIRLKAIYKNVKGTVNELKGRSSPHNLGQGIFEIASTILGQDIREHDLIKGNKWAETRIEKCTTIFQVLQLLKEQRKSLKITPPPNE